MNSKFTDNGVLPAEINMEPKGKLFGYGGRLGKEKLGVYAGEDEAECSSEQRRSRKHWKSRQSSPTNIFQHIIKGQGSALMALVGGLLASVSLVLTSYGR